MAVVLEQGGRVQEFLHGRDSAGLIFHQLFAHPEDQEKKKPTQAKKNKKDGGDKAKNTEKTKKEISPDSVRFQPPNIELQGNASAFSIYATVREYVLERDMMERALILIRANSAASKSDEAGHEDEDIGKMEDAFRLPKVVGIGLRSVFVLIRDTHSSHPILCARALQALLDMLQGQTPEGLAKEPDDMIDSLFELLLDLSIDHRLESQEPPGTLSISSLSCACLLSLIIASGNTGKMLSGIAAILMGTGRLSQQAFKVPSILSALQRSVLAVLLGKTHFPDWLTSGIPNQSQLDSWQVKEIEIDACCDNNSAIASDGSYLYIHTGTGLYKIGSGYSSTIKGHIYAVNRDFHLHERGWLGVARGQLLYKPTTFDLSGSSSSVNTVVTVNTETLVETGSVDIPATGSTSASLLFSDGENFGCVSALNDDSFVVQSFNPQSSPMSKIGELPVKLARKSLLAYGPSMNGNGKESNTEKQEIETGVSDECMYIAAGKEFTLIRTVSGKMLFAGKAQSLGIKQSAQTTTKWSELPITKSPKIVQCSVGHDGYHAALLGDDGSVYFAGTARKGEDGDQVKGRRQLKPSKPKKMLKMDGKCAVYIACNNGSTAVVTKDGELYVFGKDTHNADNSTGLLTDLKNVRVTGVALGKAHTCILTNNGIVYTMGINNKGQCGRGPSLGQGTGKDGKNANISGKEAVSPDDVCGNGVQPQGGESAVAQFMGRLVTEGEAVADILAPGAEDDAEEDERDDEQCDHEWKADQCKICSLCGLCTGYGDACVNTYQPGRNPGMVCGCGSGDSGCTKCGCCKVCAGESQEHRRGQGGALQAAIPGAVPDGGNFFGALVQHGNILQHKLLAQLRYGMNKQQDGKHRRLGFIMKQDKGKDEGSTSGDDRELERDNSQHVMHPAGPITLPSAATQVACGLHHSVVLLKNGEVYGFGLGNHGQLGQGDSGSRTAPVQLQVPEAVTQVAAGSNHTVLLGSSGNVYTCGNFQKGQLCRAILEESNAQGAVSHSRPGPVPDMGPQYGRKATWIGASGDQTFIKVDEALINPRMLENSLVFANQSVIGVVPRNGLTGVKCLMLSRVDGTCNSYSEQESSFNFGDSSVCLDPLYNVLWCFQPSTGTITCHSVIKPCVRPIPTLPSTASVLTPELALPSTPSILVSRSHCALHMLACLDTLTASQEAQLTVTAAQTEKQCITKVYTKEDFNAVNRFEGYGGGWGYSGHSVEALRFSVDTDVVLGGLGLFGGRGEYNAKIKLYELGTKASEYEPDGDPLAESDDITFECGAREKFPVLFDEPVPLTAGCWYVAWARVNGPSSDCGSGGQTSITTDDQVTFQFMSSKKSNNGTDINAGQIPQLLYRLPQLDVSSSGGVASQTEPVHILTSRFSNTVNSEVFKSLLRLLNWSWNKLAEGILVALKQGGKKLVDFTLDLERLMYIATACLRLLRSYVCEVYPSPSSISKKHSQDSSQLPESIASCCDLLRVILSNSTQPSIQHLMNRVVMETQRFRVLWESILAECHRTFVACFHAFYPSSQLKWLFLCDLLGSMSSSDQLEPNGNLLAAVLEALCHPSVHLSSVLPILRDRDCEPSIVLTKQCSMEDASPSAATAGTDVSPNPVALVTLMEERIQLDGVRQSPNFHDILDRLLNVLISPVQQALEKQPTSYPLLVSNTSRLLACVIAELSASAISSDGESQATGRPLFCTPSRYTRVSQGRGWSTGNGTPDAVCFSVDKPGILIAGFCVYGGGGHYNYELELLDGSETGADGHSHRWNSLEIVKGSYGPNDLINDVAEIKFDRPVPIKEGVKYAVRLRNHGNRTVNGDGGTTHVKCHDGVVYTFSTCPLSSNGTSQTRGQVPQILYFNSTADSEHTQTESRSVVIERQARKSALSITSTIIKAATELLYLAQGLQDAELSEILGSAHLFTSLLPLVLAHIGPVAITDPKSAVQILDLIQELLPPVADVNLQFSPPIITASATANHSMDSAASQSGEMGGVTTSPHYAVVESDHPYKPATVANYRVAFPEHVQWMLLEFDAQCGTAQPEDGLQLYIPARGVPRPKKKGEETSDDLQLTHWPVLGRFHGSNNWPTSALILPGNEVTFSLETASDYMKDEKATTFGFKCAVVGYEWSSDEEGLVQLEKELAYLGGMCAGSLLRKDIVLPPILGEDGEEEVEPIAEVAQQVFGAHSGLLGKGFALSHPPTIHQALEGSLPLSTQSNERAFLKDFVQCTHGTSGGRLARWMQPESYVDPRQCDIVFQRDDIRCSMPTIVTIMSRDQYGSLVCVSNLKVEVEAVPLGKREKTYHGAKLFKATPPGEKDLTFGGHPPPKLESPYEATIRKDSMAYNSITMMKEYELYSFEELRYASLPVTRPHESMLVRDNSDGCYSANWTPSSMGLYAIHVTIDGYMLDEVPQIEVSEPPQGVLPPNPTAKKPAQQTSKVRKFVMKQSRGLRIRSSPSLQSEEIGIVEVNGVITFIDEVHNEDGVWVRLNPETIEKYCRSNGHREGWCLQYNQHIGKTMLVPVEEPKSIYDEKPKENKGTLTTSQVQTPPSSAAAATAPAASPPPAAGAAAAAAATSPKATAHVSRLPTRPLTGGPGMYQVTNCGASGHNIRCRASIKATPIGMMVLGNQVSVTQEMAQVDGSLWVKLDKESMAHYCENTEGEAWSLAQGKGLMYLIHEADLTSADREKARKSRPFLFFGDSSKHRNKVSGFDFKNAQATPAMGFAPTNLTPFMFGASKPRPPFDQNGEQEQIGVVERESRMSNSVLDTPKHKAQGPWPHGGVGMANGFAGNGIDPLDDFVAGGGEAILSPRHHGDMPSSAVPGAGGHQGNFKRSSIDSETGAEEPSPFQNSNHRDIINSNSIPEGMSALDRESTSPLKADTATPESKDQQASGSDGSGAAGSTQWTSKGHFSIGVSDGQGSPKTGMSPKQGRKSRTVFGKRDRTASPSSKDRSPARIKASTAKTEIKESAQAAIATSVAECARCVFAAFLWHEGLVHDAMACASFLKFNPHLGKQTSHQPKDPQREAKLKNRHSMDFSKSLNDGMFFSETRNSNRDVLNQNEADLPTSPGPVISGEQREHVQDIAKAPIEESPKSTPALQHLAEKLAKASPLSSPKHSPKHFPKGSPSRSPKVRKQQGTVLIKGENGVSSSDSDQRERASSTGADSVNHRNAVRDSESLKPPMEAQLPSILPVTLKFLLSFWEELTQATINIASQQLVLPSPAPITKSRSRIESKSRDKEKDPKGKKRRDKSVRGGRGNLFGEAAGVPVGGSDRETVCDLCHGVFPHPVTYHMRQSHPGCGRHAGGQGYNSSGHYCGGWAGNCGDGGVGGSSWYLMCERCREKYIRERQDKLKDKVKKQRKKLPPLKTPKMLPPLEAHHVMKANAMFLLDLASAAGPTYPGTSPMRKATRFDLPILSETEALSSQFPPVPFQFVKLMRRGSVSDCHTLMVEGRSIHMMSRTDHEIPVPLTKSASVDGKRLVDEGMDSSKRVAYFRSISMTGQVGNQAETKTKMRRRNNSSSSSEDGSSLLRRPSALLAKLMKGGSKGFRALHRPVMSFIVQRHDLEGLQLAMKQALRKASCRVYALQALNWLLRSVTQLTSLHDLLWHYVGALTPLGPEKEEEVADADKGKGKEEKKDKKEPEQQDIDGLMCEHPLSDISIAGEAVHPLPTSFHTLLQTVADMMMLLPHGSALQQMAMRCWCLRFRPADHVFLHHSHVFSNINQILSRSDSQEGEGEDSVASSSDSLPASLNTAKVELLRDVTNATELLVSSRAAMLPSLTDGSTETFWESGDEDRNRTKSITVTCNDGLVARMVAVHVDNSRDLGNKVTGVTFFIGPNSEFLLKTLNSNLEARHVGWVTCNLDLCTESPKIIKVELRGPDSHLRVRQVKVLGQNEGENLSTGPQQSAQALQQKNCEAETLRVFRLLTSQVFGKLLSDEESGEDRLEENGEKQDEDAADIGDPDLREHMVGILFSRSKLTNLQKQVCSHIVQAIRKETTKMREEWESNLATRPAAVVLSPVDDPQSLLSTDAYCFELLSMVLALSGSSVGRIYVAQQATLLQDLLSLLHTGTPRVQRQVTSIIRRLLPEIPPTHFAKLTGVTSLPPADLSILTQSSDKPNPESSTEESVGILDIFLACVAKTLTVQSKVKGGGGQIPGLGGKGTHSLTLARLQQLYPVEESPSKRSSKGRWWMRGSISHNIAERVIGLIKDMSAGKLSEVWANVTKGAIAEAVLSLTKLDEAKRQPAECIKTHTLWLSLSSLCVLETEHVERLSSSQWGHSKEAGAMKQKPTCDNHDDGETPAIILCNECANLCAECDKVLHLHRRTRSHQRKVFKEEEEAIKVDLHEGCGRSKLFWIMTLTDSKTLKAMVEFKEAASGNSASAAAGSTVGTCRFCGSLATSGLLAVGSVCDDPDCQKHIKNACTKTLPCGHLCGGVKDEDVCLPCLHGCSRDVSLKQDADDMCMICFTEALACAPAIQLDCGHVFHQHCCQNVLERQWVGPRITFGFSLCPICKANMEHKVLHDVLAPITDLQADVRRKALMRLEYEGLHNCEAITTPGARFYNDTAGFAMNRYAYYVCFKCKKAYYGGEARCDQEIGIQGDYDPTELVCGACSDVSRAQMCPKHGTDFLEYKCRYCCSVAVFFCFGRTHFCNACHDDFQRITSIPKPDLPHCPAGPRAKQLEGDECPLHVEHPPTGEEFALGCGVCRNAHTF
ncbi:E3 ubiquitin-protein ligase MYCBP2-like isoform X2 [Asterias rubens]|uniref:E3 ubiquitin-protein ligase MYCBP2-like isoform X2 n=1 Tax=Asterias rubens TaxID=7604 RepID=UPI001454F771|nr:E3 ubiquitin-protein ligase MYCBP2-like isoform X2 [Asterias rubens]